MNKAIDTSEYKEYMTVQETEAVHKLALNPTYANVPLNELITIALSSRIVEIGAKMAQKANEKIQNTSLPSANNGNGTTGTKDVSQMTDAEYAEYRKTLPGIQ